MPTKTTTNQTQTSQPFTNTSGSTGTTQGATSGTATTAGTTGFTNQNIFATPLGVNQTQLVNQLGSFQGAGRDVISGYMQNPSPFFNQIQARGQEIAGLNTQQNIENIFSQAGRNTYGSVPGFTQEAISRAQRAGQAQFSDFTRQNALSAEAARGQAAQFAAGYVPPTIGAQGTTATTADTQTAGTAGSTTSATGTTTVGSQSVASTSVTTNEGLGTWLPTAAGGVAGFLLDLFKPKDSQGNATVGQAAGDLLFGEGGLIGAGWAEKIAETAGMGVDALGGGIAAGVGALTGAAQVAVKFLMSNPWTIAAGAALTAYLVFRSKIGAGRKTADKIVPTQNELTTNLGTTIDGFWEDYNAGDIKSPEQVQGIIDIIELLQTEFTDFTNEFGDDTKAPQQARDTMDPLFRDLLQGTTDPNDLGLYGMLDTITELADQDINDPSTWIGDDGQFKHWPGQDISQQQDSTQQQAGGATTSDPATTSDSSAVTDSSAASWAGTATNSTQNPLLGAADVQYPSNKGTPIAPSSLSDPAQSSAPYGTITQQGSDVFSGGNSYSFRDPYTGETAQGTMPQYKWDAATGKWVLESEAVNRTGSDSTSSTIQKQLALLQGGY